MPATRSSSKQPQPPVPPYPANEPTKRRPVTNPDVIVVSSDDDEPLARRAGPSRKPHAANKSRKPKKASPATRHDDDIIELTSGDETPNVNLSSTAADSELLELQNDNERLKRANAQLEKDLSRISQTLATKKQELKYQKEVSALDSAKFEDTICCEVCTLKMWSPYILAECGHSFCQSCLQDWFSTTLTHHMTAHPNFRQGQTISNQARALLMQPTILFDSRLQHHLQSMLAQHHAPHPEYNCPKCRAIVLTRPAEDFKLKAVVRLLADAVGESSPRKDGPVRNRPIGGPFDGFFPERIVTM